MVFLFTVRRMVVQYHLSDFYQMYSYEVFYGQKPRIHFPYIVGETANEMVHKYLAAKETIL